MKENRWSQWRPFPHPHKCDFLVAPFGPGCYRLRDGQQLVLFGESGHVAHRMSTLLPKGYGRGGRKNESKRAYVLAHIASVEYQTIACVTKKSAQEVQGGLRKEKHLYLFPT